MVVDRDVSRDGPLGLIAGSGALPGELAARVRAGGRAVFVVGLEGAVEPQWYEDYPHIIVGMGQVGLLLRRLTQEGVRDVLLVGALVRPHLAQIRPDLGLIRILPSVARLFRGGDDHLLRGVASLFESKGFRVVSPAEIVPGLTIGLKQLTKTTPNSRALTSIRIGCAALGALSPHDVGQACVVIDQRIVAIEGIEGTDEMLQRVADLRVRGRLRAPSGRGVLVKMPKIGQDRRVDMPTIGAATVRQAAAAGLGGIGLARDVVIIVDQAATIGEADRLGLFLFGFEPPSS